MVHLGLFLSLQAASPPPACAATPASLTPATWTSRARSSADRGVPWPLGLVADILLPGRATRFDYQSVDSERGRLYISHMGDGRLVVVDMRADSVVADVPGVPGATGVWAVPEVHRVYVSASGRSEVAVVDDRSLEIVARIPGPRFPDGIANAPGAGRVFVSDEAGAADFAIDIATNRVVARISLGGEAGNTHYDPVSGCILVAEQTHDQLIAIDPASARIVAQYSLAGARGLHGFALDTGRRLAFITGEDDAKLLVVDLRTMRVAAVHPVGDRPDVLAFDAALGVLYVAAEGGVVTAFVEESTGLRRLGELRIPQAHSVAVDPTTHRVYLPLANLNGRPVLRILAPPLR